MSTTGVPLSDGAWIGVWVRQRSGPTIRGSVIEVGLWHRIASVAADRVVLACAGPRRAKVLLWPSGGARWEIARPLLEMWEQSDLKGDTCRVCLERRPRLDAAPEVTVESQMPDEDVDDIIDRILDRMRQRAERRMEAPDVR